MPFVRLDTAVGEFWLDNPGTYDVRVGVSDVETVDNLGPNSTYRWSADQEEALMAAASEAGGSLELLVPGGWRLAPAECFSAFQEALLRIANSMEPSERRTPVRG